MDNKAYQRKIKKHMKALDTYKDEFNKSIEILAQMLADFDIAYEQFVHSGGEFITAHTNKNGSTNKVKNPYYLVIEGLRQDILQYSRELGLTPTGLKKLNAAGLDKKDGSKFENIMAGFLNGGKTE